jgi:hypothetical protein
MNDPHIEALHYRIKHASTVDFENAPPVEHPGPGCSVRIENGEVKITMKDHHPTIEDARDAVEPFLCGMVNSVSGSAISLATSSSSSSMVADPPRDRMDWTVGGRYFSKLGKSLLSAIGSAS